MASIPELTLNDGRTIPQLGFGVYKIPESETADAVVTAAQALMWAVLRRAGVEIAGADHSLSRVSAGVR